MSEKTSKIIPPKIAAALDLMLEHGAAAYEIGQDGKRRIRILAGQQPLFELVESGSSASSELAP